MDRPAFKRNGPTADEIEIIGIEFTIQRPDSSRVEELEMFRTAGLIIPRMRTVNGGYGWGNYTPRITFHTNDGDFTISGIAPW